MGELRLKTLDDVKRDAVLTRWYMMGQNLTKTAKTLGVSLRGLRYMLRRMGVEPLALGVHRKRKDKK